MKRFLFFAKLALVFSLASIPFAGAQPKDPVAKDLGLTPDTKALPVWASPSADARLGLGKMTRALVKGVALVGAPKTGHGTAWVISREHRLLATNAHVADIMHRAGKMIAVPSGTSQVYNVERVWYHPGVQRYLGGDASKSLRSMDPRDGPINTRSPDLAVLQLAAGGPELPVELPMATPEELKDLFAQPAAILGFPGHDFKWWPGQGEKAAATFHDGVISRITDFRLSASGGDSELQFVQYTMATWPGFSGSPVYLPNGHVVAVHNSVRPSGKGSFNEVKNIPHGVRVDCLWELLVHHGLEGKVPIKFDRTALNIRRWIEPDAREQKIRADFQRATNLVREARHLIYNKEDFKNGVDRCNEAVKLAPNLADAYRVRGDGFTNYWFKNRRDGGLAFADGMRMLDSAKWDAEKYVQLVGSTDPDAILTLTLVFNNTGAYKDDNSFNRKALAVLRKLEATDNLNNYNRARTLSQIGIALNNVGDNDEALRYHNAAINLEPNEPVFYETRADFWRALGRRDREQQDYATARKLRQGQIQNPPPGAGGEEILNVRSRLTNDDGKDRVRTNSFSKVHTLRMVQGRTYQIDLKSSDFDPFLRVEDSSFEQVAEDDDGGGNLQARLVFRATRTDTYRLIVTSYAGGKTGTYTLTVQQR